MTSQQVLSPHGFEPSLLFPFVGVFVKPMVAAVFSFDPNPKGGDDGSEPGAGRLISSTV